MHAISPRRVLILGRPGAGKTTLARQIAERLDLPGIHLDDWRRGRTGRVPRERLSARAESTASTRSWVAEGIFVTWTTPLMEAADLIVLLDLPRTVLAYRIWRRRLTDAQQRRDHSFLATVRFTWGSVRGHTLEEIFRAEANLPPSSRALRQVLMPHADRVVVILQRAALHELLAALCVT